MFFINNLFSFSKMAGFVLVGLFSMMNFGVLASSPGALNFTKSSYDHIGNTKSLQEPFFKKDFISLKLKNKSILSQVLQYTLAIVILLTFAVYLARCLRALNTKRSLRRLAADGENENDCPTQANASTQGDGDEGNKDKQGATKGDGPSTSAAAEGAKAAEEGGEPYPYAAEEEYFGTSRYYGDFTGPYLQRGDYAIALQQSKTLSAKAAFLLGKGLTPEQKEELAAAKQRVKDARQEEKDEAELNLKKLKKKIKIDIELAKIALQRAGEATKLNPPTRFPANEEQ